MVIEMPFYYQESMTRESTKVYAYHLDYNIFTACAVTFFAYSCQIQLLPVYSELVNPNHSRILKVIRRSILADMLFYMVIATSGYFSTFNRTQTIGVEREPLNGYPRDYFMMLGIGGVLAMLMVAIPISYIPWRY